MFNKNIQNWIMAFRPKTLAAAISPVLIGSAMAFGDGVHHELSALVCLFTALAIQIGTNLANDYYDYKKGADTEERIGPTRVTQAGLIKPETVRLSFNMTFSCAALASLYLIARGGWPIAIIGVLSITSGILYTAGPKPLGYIGLGDLFVLIFFGPVAVAGTYYVQSLEMNLAVLLTGLGPGFISAAILTVNNLRDIESDAKSGKRTLAVRFGKTFAMAEYLVCIFLAALLPIVLVFIMEDHYPIMMASSIILFAIPGIITVLTKSAGKALNNALAFTGKLLLIYSVIFSIGWLL